MNTTTSPDHLSSKDRATNERTNYSNDATGATASAPVSRSRARRQKITGVAKILVAVVAVIIISGVSFAVGVHTGKNSKTTGFPNRSGSMQPPSGGFGQMPGSSGSSSGQSQTDSDIGSSSTLQSN